MAAALLGRSSGQWAQPRHDARGRRRHLRDQRSVSLAGRPAGPSRETVTASSDHTIVPCHRVDSSVRLGRRHPQGSTRNSVEVARAPIGPSTNGRWEATAKSGTLRYPVHAGITLQTPAVHHLTVRKRRRGHCIACRTNNSHCFAPNPSCRSAAARRARSPVLACTAARFGARCAAGPHQARRTVAARLVGRQRAHRCAEGRRRHPRGPHRRDGQPRAARRHRRGLRLLVDPAAVVGGPARRQRYARPGLRPPPSDVARLPQAASSRRPHRSRHRRRRLHAGHARPGPGQPVPQPAARRRDVRRDDDRRPVPDAAQPDDHASAGDLRAPLQADASPRLATCPQGGRSGCVVGDREPWRDRSGAGLHARAAPVGPLRAVVWRQPECRRRGGSIAGAVSLRWSRPRACCRRSSCCGSVLPGLPTARCSSACC